MPETGSNQIPVSVYPNPFRTTSVFNVKEQAQLAVFDSQGRLVYSGQLSKGDNTIGAELPSGLYIARVDDGRSVKIIRLIKEQ